MKGRGDALTVSGGIFRKGSKHVELGAFVVVPGGGNVTGMREAARGLAGFEAPRAPAASRMPILGNDVLHSWMERVRKLGVQSLWLASGARADAATTALAEFARQGIERLLVIELKSYAEMDLSDLLRFHCERRNPVTEAHDARGQLGVRLLDHPALRATGEKHEPCCSAIEGARTPYQFSGYAKRILSARERQELVGDGLTGACAMRPVGTQIREQVWIGEGVNLADFCPDHRSNLHRRSHNRNGWHHHRSICVSGARLCGGLRNHGGTIHRSARYLPGAGPAHSQWSGGRGTLGRSGLERGGRSGAGRFGKQDSEAWIAETTFQPLHDGWLFARQRLRAEFRFIFPRVAALATGTAVKGSIVKGEAMNGAAWTVLPFPSASSSASRRAQRKDLLNALRVSGSPVILDFSECHSLSFEDIDLLLECLAQVAGRDTQVVFVAGSSGNPGAPRSDPHFFARAGIQFD